MNKILKTNKKAKKDKETAKKAKHLNYNNFD